MEKFLTKYFWVLNIITLAAIAYFLADGTGQFTAAKLGDLFQNKEPIRKTLKSRPSTQRPWATPNGTEIIDRNIFNSSFSPDDDLGDEPAPDVRPPDGADLPLVPCTDGKVKLLATVASRYVTDWSFASIELNREKKLCRVGDNIEGRTISGITWRYLFMRGTSDECYIDLFSSPEDMAKGPRRDGRREERVALSDNPDDLKNSIQNISDTEKVVDRAAVDKVLSDPTKFIRSVRVRPQKENGKVVGFALRRFQPNSPLALLGAQRGDIIHSVNGVDLTSVDQALNAYQSLRSSNDLTFSITRNGKPMDIHIKVQ
jgi:type II secretion system protein C